MIKNNLVLVVAMLFAFVACSNGTTAQQQPIVTKKVEKQKVIILTVKFLQ